MMNSFKSRGLCAMLAITCLLVLAGCKTDQPGVTNRAGTIKATLAANPQSVTDAAKKTLEDMDLVIISSNATAIDGRIIARTAQDVRIRVDSESIGDNVSEVFIRVGNMGDSDLSLTILNKIKEKLGITSDMKAEDESTTEEKK